MKFVFKNKYLVDSLSKKKKKKKKYKSIYKYN